MHTCTRLTATVSGVLAAVLFGLAAQNAADAAIRVSYGGLVAVAASNPIASIPNAGTCPDADSSAGITEPYPAQWLKLIATQTDHAAVKVRVDLDSVGNLMQASVAKSSGNTFLDEQALVAARGSKYAPEVHNCNSFKQSYFYDITFDTFMVVLPDINSGSTRKPVR